jgi:hypothetical protein
MTEIKQLGINETALAASHTTSWVVNGKYSLMRICYVQTVASLDLLCAFSFNGVGTDILVTETVTAANGYVDIPLRGKFVRIEYFPGAFPADVKSQVFFVKKTNNSGGGGGSSTDSSVYFVESNSISVGDTDFIAHANTYNAMSRCATSSGPNGCTLTEMSIYSSVSTNTKIIEVIESVNGTAYASPYNLQCSGTGHITNSGSISHTIAKDQIIAVRGKSGGVGSSAIYVVTLRLEYN